MREQHWWRWLADAGLPKHFAQWPTQQISLHLLQTIPPLVPRVSTDWTLADAQIFKDRMEQLRRRLSRGKQVAAIERLAQVLDVQISELFGQPIEPGDVQ